MKMIDGKKWHEAVDWKQTNSAIARRVGLSHQGVRAGRLRYAPVDMRLSPRTRSDAKAKQLREWIQSHPGRAARMLPREILVESGCADLSRQTVANVLRELGVDVAQNAPTSVEELKSWCRVNQLTGCWVLPVRDVGYPNIGREPACRYVYHHFCGGLAADQVVRHACDNRGCVNPAHLETGTNLDNIRDKMERSMRPGGKKALGPRELGVIRRRATNYERTARLARVLGVNPSTVFRAATRRTYKHGAE